MTEQANPMTTTAKPLLRLRRETLRTLNPDELRQVIGGAARRSQCSYEESGCIN